MQTLWSVLSYSPQPIILWESTKLLWVFSWQNSKTYNQMYTPEIHFEAALMLRDSVGMHGLSNYKIWQHALPEHLRESSHHHEKYYQTSHNGQGSGWNGWNAVQKRWWSSCSHETRHKDLRSPEDWQHKPRNPSERPTDNQKVALNLVKSPPSPPSVASTTPPKQTQPHTNKSHGMGQVVAGRNDNDEDHWVQEHTNDPAHRADTSLDETTAGAIVSMPMDVAAPHYNLAKAITRQSTQAHKVHCMTTQTKTPKWWAYQNCQRTLGMQWMTTHVIPMHPQSCLTSSGHERLRRWAVGRDKHVGNVERAWRGYRKWKQQWMST